MSDDNFAEGEYQWHNWYKWCSNWFFLYLLPPCFTSYKVHVLQQGKTANSNTTSRSAISGIVKRCGNYNSQEIIANSLEFEW